MTANGITGETQDKIVLSITSFALYGFPPGLLFSVSHETRAQPRGISSLYGGEGGIRTHG
jgi:hypothetical protein